MPFSFFKKNKVEPEAKPIAQPAIKPTTSDKLTGKEWFYTIITAGIYLCFRKGKKTEEQADVSQLPRRMSIPDIAETKPAKSEATETTHIADKYDIITANLVLLKTALGKSEGNFSKTQTTYLDSGVITNFQSILAQYKDNPVLKTSYITLAIVSDLDRINKQLSTLEQLQNALAQDSTELQKPSAIRLLAEFESTILQYRRLRAKLIFKQHEAELAAQLTKPAQALTEVNRNLDGLKSETVIRRVATTDAKETKPYDRNSVPELTSHNDPKKFLEQRANEFNTIQQTLQSVITESGAVGTTLPELKTTTISDEEDSEKRFMEEVQATHDKTTAQLQGLKSQPICQGIHGEIDVLVDRYRSVLPNIDQGHKAAAAYRKQELLHTIRQNPGLNAYFEKFKELLRSAIMGAGATLSGFVTSTKTTEEVVTGYVTAALQQVPLPGIGVACTIADCVGEYVGQLRKEAKLQNLKKWDEYVSNPEWLEEVALMATIAKRKEIAEMTAKGQEDIDRPKRIKKLETQIEDLNISIKGAEKDAKESAIAAKVAIEALNQQKEVFKNQKLKTEIKYQTKAKSKIAKLKTELDRKCKGGTEESIWSLICANKIVDKNDPRIAKSKFKNDFSTYIGLQNDLIATLATIDKAISNDQRLKSLKKAADSATVRAEDTAFALDSLREKLQCTQQTLQLLKGKTSLRDDIKGKVSGWQEAIDKAIKSGLEKTTGEDVATSAGNAIAIQDFASILTKITNSTELESGHDAESAKSRLLSYVVNQNPEKPDIDFDTTRASGKKLQNYFFYSRNTHVSSLTTDYKPSVMTDYFATKSLEGSSEELLRQPVVVTAKSQEAIH